MCSVSASLSAAAAVVQSVSRSLRPSTTLVRAAADKEGRSAPSLRSAEGKTDAPSAAVVRSLTFFLANETLVSMLLSSLEASLAARSAKVTS